MMTQFKSLFTGLTIRRQLMLLTFLFLGGFLIFSFLAHDTLTSTKVNGPQYDRIIQGKDLIADVLPPPEYIIEAQLVVLQMVDTTDLERLLPLMKSFDQLESDYVRRHTFWVGNLPDGPLKDMMVVQSFEPARRFFVTARRDLFPLLLSGEQTAADELAKGVLRECYEQHRAAIDQVVEMSKARIADDEQAARQVIADRTTMLICFGFVLALLVAFGSELIGRRIASRLDEMVRVLDAVAAGDLSQHLKACGEDEIHHMGVALNKAIAASRHNLAATKAAEQTVRELNVDLEQRVSQRTLALHESEQRLVAILDTAIDSIITIDGRGRIESVNPAAEQMFGYSLAEMIGQNIKMLIPSPHREAHDGYLANLVQTGTERLVGLRREVIGQRKDGVIFPADLAISSANLPDRHQFTGIVRDITRRKKIETDLALAKETAEAANQAKSAFLAAMSHELRTPLNGILGMNELLRGTDMTNRQREFVDAGHTSGKLLLQLINNVLDLSKIESGKLELDLQECSVEALVYDVVEVLKHVAKQKGLGLRAHVGANACVTVLADETRLRQILTNLIGNAIKFTTTGFVTIDAECRPSQAGSILAVFTVTDSGIGIPEAKRNRLFSPFTQADSSTTRQFGGTGLGLAICRQLVEAMHGTIGFDSRIGCGSTFWFEVPLMLAHTQMPGVDRTSPITRARLLVVADDLPDQEQILDCLRAWGCPFEMARTPEEALQAVSLAKSRQTAFDVALIGFSETTSTCHDLIDTLARSHGLPVIGFGTVPDESESALLRQCGIRLHLPGPVRPSVLFDSLVAVLAVPTSAVEANATETFATRTAPLSLAAHVLIAEDNSINQLYVTELLKHLDCTSDVAANGDEALEALQRGRYDLVLMDCQMPEMDGFTASREFRRREAERQPSIRIPIIALTANALKGDRERCLDAGMDDYLTKPLQAAQLQAMLMQYLVPALARTEESQGCGVDS